MRPGPDAQSPRKILIVAPNASSRFGGEAFLPLKYFQILRQRGLPVKLIAHARNKAEACDVDRACNDLATWPPIAARIEELRHEKNGV